MPPFPDQASYPEYIRTSPDYTIHGRTSPDFEGSDTTAGDEVKETTETEQTKSSEYPEQDIYMV
jgi:hypothetical protein